MFLLVSKWIKCPVCGNKTRDKIQEDTIMRNFPLYCPKCKNESLINVETLNVQVVNKTTNRTL